MSLVKIIRSNLTIKYMNGNRNHQLVSYINRLHNQVCQQCSNNIINRYFLTYSALARHSSHFSSSGYEKEKPMFDISISKLPSRLENGRLSREDDFITEADIREHDRMYADLNEDPFAEDSYDIEEVNSIRPSLP